MWESTSAATRAYYQPQTIHYNMDQLQKYAPPPPHWCMIMTYPWVVVAWPLLYQDEGQLTVPLD